MYCFPTDTEVVPADAVVVPADAEVEEVIPVDVDMGVDVNAGVIPADVDAIANPEVGPVQAAVNQAGLVTPIDVYAQPFTSVFVVLYSSGECRVFCKIVLLYLVTIFQHTQNIHY